MLDVDRLVSLVCADVWLFSDWVDTDVRFSSRHEEGSSSTGGIGGGDTDGNGGDGGSCGGDDDGDEDGSLDGRCDGDVNDSHGTMSSFLQLLPASPSSDADCNGVWLGHSVRFFILVELLMVSAFGCDLCLAFNTVSSANFIISTSPSRGITSSII